MGLVLSKPNPQVNLVQKHFKKNNSPHFKGLRLASLSKGPD